MKKKQVIRRKSSNLPQYQNGGYNSGIDFDKLYTTSTMGSNFDYGLEYSAQGMSDALGAGSVASGIGDSASGIAGSLFAGVGMIGGFLDGLINGKKNAAYEESEKRRQYLSLMQSNMYTGATNPNNTMGQTVKYPYGGMMQPNAEVEGGEVLKQPNGQVNTMQGPSHAQGGIDVNAPQGTKVYSDRIKHKVGNKYETYAETAAKLNKILDKYKKVDKNEDTLKKNSDALMIARIQQKLDNLFDEQEMQKTAQGIEHPEQQTMAYGGITGRPPFDEWYKTVPASKNDTNFYNLRRAYDLAPQDQLDAFVKDPNAHLYSAYENKETGVYEFMKKKNHPTLQKELDWYNSNDNEAVDFKNKYSLDTNGDYYKYVPKKKLMMDQSGPYNKKLEMNQTGPYYQKLMMDQKGPYNEKLMMEQRQIKNRQLMMDQTGPYYQKLMMDQTKRQINPSQLKFAYGGTTGWPPYKEYNPYTMNPSGIDIPIEEETQTDLNNRARFINPVGQIDIEEEMKNSYITPMPSISPKSINIPLGQSTPIGKTKELTGIDGMPDTMPEKKKTDWAGIGSTALEAAPMIYNLLQKKPDQMPTAPYMDTQMVTPERMSNEQDLREAERNYSAIVNDQSLPVAQRLLASRQLQSTKAQILQQTENQYKQDINRAQEVNAAKIHKNIDTAMKIKDINDANIGAYANQRAQAMGDISQLAQKKTLEKNMAKKNDMMFNALQSAFPDYSFKSDGTVVHKSGKPLTPEQLEALNKYKQNLYYTSMIKSGSYMPQYNESYYNQIGNTLEN